MLDPNLGIPVDNRSFSLSTNNPVTSSTADSLFPALKTNSAASSAASNPTGLKAEYFNDPNFGQLALTRTDKTVNFDWGLDSPNLGVNSDYFTVRWTGQVLPRYSETYTFYTQADDRVRLWVNEQLLVDRWSQSSVVEDRGSITLQAGQSYNIRLEYAEDQILAAAKLLWSSPSQLKEIIPESQLLSSSLPTTTYRAADLTSSVRDIDVFNPAPINDALDPTNLIDTYRFTLDDSAAINFGVSNLAANVDLKLLTVEGTVVETSANDGTTNEAIATVLGAGMYLLQVYANQPVTTKYTLASVISQTIREQARPADSFIDSIGIATHLRYTDTSYGRYYDVVEPRLRELGIRHIRDGGNNADMFAKMRRLATFGIRSTLVMDPRDGIMPSNAVQIIQQVQPAVEAIEGPNEWDVNQTTMTYKGKTFPNGLRDYQADLYQAVKGNPLTANVSVIAPSMAYPENGNKLGSLAQFSDYGNMHSYAGGNVPGQDVDWRWIPLTQAVSGDRSIMVTETGYHNAVNDPKAGQKGVTEEVSAKYLPRTLLEYFNRGVKRTFLYELMDLHARPGQENNFGIIRADGTPKPAFYAIRNLIGLLNDTPGTTPGGSLSYYFSGEVKNLRHTLLQKSNGDFYLVLWLNSESSSTAQSQQVTVNLITPTQNAAIYLPNQSMDATASYTTPTRIAVTVPDAPLVVKLTPKS